MDVLVYQETNGLGADGVVKELVAFAKDPDIERNRAAIHFREVMRYMNRSKRLCGAPVSTHLYKTTALTPTAGLWTNRFHAFGLYWTRVASGHLTVQVRAVLIDRRDDEKRCVDNSIRRHNNSGPVWHPLP